MRLAFLLVFATAFWLLGCAGIAVKFGADHFSLLWAPIIASLNREPGGQSATDLTADLVQIYRREIHEAEAAWSVVPHDTELTKADRARLKSRFVHDALQHKQVQDWQTFIATGKSWLARPSYKDIATAALTAVESHPTARSSMVTDYSQGDQVGFCFGRALLIHYYLLKAGVPQRAITKIFALGSFNMAGQFWHFHVAVMVEDRDGFLIIDPLYGDAPATHADWVANLARLEMKYPQPWTRFFITDPRKFLPTGGIYSVAAISAPELRHYFADLATHLDP